MMNKSNSFIKLTLIFSFLMMLIMGASPGSQATAMMAAPSVIFDYMNGDLDAPSSTFTFDVLIDNIMLSNLKEWNLAFTITRNSDPGVPFSFHYAAITTDSNYVFAGNSNGYQIDINPPSATATQFSLLGHDATNSGSVTDTTGKLLARLILDEVQYQDSFIITIDPVNSFFIDSGNNYSYMESDVYDVNVVPIPSTLLLMAGGLLGLLISRRKNKRA
ncbi:MAG: PEP-CTERM sorting domain-containing protein [Proteobacteria bacterium]|nr:PEP-CTERM sorting domain-containing protein [Pseudomonadota bacterium]